ncbi:MAG: nucleotidyltransferase domain-containing protein [Defluviitaleaceae bacterium]|nr:nucleotidyltransferase domain-containing protein [Defluviitaleaceae bacterium]
MSLKTVEALEELNIPEKYTDFLKEFLASIKADDRVKRVILFGSCARGEVRTHSDIDILVTTNGEIGEEAELKMYDYLPDVFGENYVPCDLIVMSERRFEENKHIMGAVQKYIYTDGVDLRELL